MPTLEDGGFGPNTPENDSDKKMLEFFMEAARIQALIHTGSDHCDHGVKVGNTCSDCLGAAKLILAEREPLELPACLPVNAEDST
jgi:hypothetical protein